METRGNAGFRWRIFFAYNSACAPARYDPSPEKLSAAIHEFVFANGDYLLLSLSLPAPAAEQAVAWNLTR